MSATIKPAKYLCPKCDLCRYCDTRGEAWEHCSFCDVDTEPLFTRADLVAAMKMGAESTLRWCDISLVNMPTDNRIEYELSEMLGEQKGGGWCT